MITTYATIAFFLVYGISKFMTLKYAPKVLGVLALIIGVAMIANN